RRACRRRQLADLCSHIALAKLEHQPVDAAEREIPSKDHTHPLGLLCHYGELAILEFVSQRHHSADPQPLALGGRHLVANALGGDLPLELREREQHVQGEPAHRGGRVELLGHRNERHPVGRRSRPSFLRTTPAKKPRTECCCQSVARMMAAIVAPSPRPSMASTELVSTLAGLRARSQLWSSPCLSDASCERTSAL